MKKRNGGRTAAAEKEKEKKKGKKNEKEIKFFSLLGKTNKDLGKEFNSKNKIGINLYAARAPK